MYRGTTPTLPIRIHGIDLTQAKIFLSIWGEEKESIFTLTTPEDFTVDYDRENDETSGEITLTQEQTLALSAGSCQAQIRFVFPDGRAGATPPREIGVKDVFLKDVIAYD